MAFCGDVFLQAHLYCSTGALHDAYQDSVGGIWLPKYR